MRVYPNYYKKLHNYIKNFSLIEYKNFFKCIYKNGWRKYNF